MEEIVTFIFIDILEKEKRKTFSSSSEAPKGNLSNRASKKSRGGRDKNLNR